MKKHLISTIRETINDHPSKRSIAKLSAHKHEILECISRATVRIADDFQHIYLDVLCSTDTPVMLDFMQAYIHTHLGATEWLADLLHTHHFARLEISDEVTYMLHKSFMTVTIPTKLVIIYKRE
jgi:hypothetical protein